MTNAKIMKEGLQNCGLTVYGGDNAPYLWLKTPDSLSSWKFFDKLLYEVKIVGTPEWDSDRAGKVIYASPLSAIGMTP